MYLKHLTLFLIHSVFSIFSSYSVIIFNSSLLNDNAPKIFSFGLFSFGKFINVGMNIGLKHLHIYIALGIY